ncbi:MAG: D-alanine--D-alanine ligase [Candidatus Margulisiibacteriota bacterium]
MDKLKKMNIAVLMGGKSSEREVSLRSGKNVMESLKKQGFKNIFQMDLGGDLLGKLIKNKVDVVFIALHGKYGEDGCVQGLLEIAGIPYTGSRVLASALAMDKVQAKRIFQARGIPTPNYSIIDLSVDIKKEAERILRLFPLPLVVKPVSEGSSVGVTIVKEEDNLPGILKAAVAEFSSVFVEEFIKGKEVTVGIIGEETLPILELSPKSEFYDYKAKYTKGGTDFILPARLSKPLAKRVQATALAAHRILGCRGFSRVDIIVSGDHVPFVHEVNTIPGLTDLSDLPAAAAHAGISFDELILRILQSAFKA